MTGDARCHGKTRGVAGPLAEKTVSLALQGGEAHGAFTCGVLDALLEDGRLAVEAITGPSAGAMNAVGWRAGSTGRAARLKRFGAGQASTGSFPRPSAGFSA
jgi:NTE family protein